MKIFSCLTLLLLAAIVLAVEDRLSPLASVATEETARTATPEVASSRADRPSAEIAPAKIPGTLARKRIVAIDVGHTRVSPGAISATGLPEYEFNLRIAHQVRSALTKSRDIEPFVIASEKAMSLVARTKIAADRRADIFVSIHHDSAQDKYLKEWEPEPGGKKQSYTDKFSGYGVFMSRKNPHPEESLAIAKKIGRAMAASGFHFASHHAEKVRGEGRPIIDDEAGIYAFDDLVVLKTATMPAVLVECGVILNREEEQSLLTPERQAAIATAIVDGIEEYFAQAPATLPHPPFVKAPIERPAPVLKSSELGPALETQPGLHPRTRKTSEAEPASGAGEAKPTPRKDPKPGTPLKPFPVRNNPGQH